MNEIKIIIRRAKPKPLPKLAKGDFMDPTIELERDCTHVAELSVTGQETKVFVGNSKKDVLRLAIDHISFQPDAYSEVLMPGEPMTEAQVSAMARLMEIAGFTIPEKTQKPPVMPKPKKRIAQPPKKKVK